MATIQNIEELKLGTGSQLDLTDKLNANLKKLKSNDDSIAKDVSDVQVQLDGVLEDYISKGSSVSSKDEDVFGKKTFKGGIAVNTIQNESGTSVNVDDIVTKTKAQTLTNKTINGDNNTFQNIPITSVKNLMQDGKISTSLLPDFVAGQMLFGGLVNKSGVVTVSDQFKSKYPTETTVTLTTSNHSNYSGVYFIAQDETSFTDVTIAGVAKVSTGDWIVSVASGWKKIDNTDAVTSVDGKTGVVVTNSVTHTAQTLTDAQKLQARKNIGIEISNVVGSGSGGAIIDSDKTDTSLITKGAVATAIQILQSTQTLTSRSNFVKTYWTDDSTYKKLTITNAKVTSSSILSSVYSSGNNTNITNDYVGKPIMCEAFAQEGKIIIRAHEAFSGYINFVS